jgi:AcrR family transcriptional regulator
MAMTRQFDEDAVLRSVLDVFWAKGWQATSMADLAGAANVQRGSLYHAYGGKGQLFELAFDRYAQHVLEESRAALDAPTAARALEQFFEVSIASMTAGAPPRGCLTTKTAVEGDIVDASIRRRVRELLEGLEQALVDALSREPLRGALNETPQRTAQLIVVFTRGLAVMERIDHDADRLRALGRDFVSLLVKRGR